MRALLLMAVGVSLLALSCGRTPVEVEAPLFVFTGAICPDAGTEADLALRGSDSLALVRFRAMGECSGLGGEWLIGREEGSTRDLSVGEHGCFFQPPAVRDATAERFAVVRFNQTAALFHGPTGWCITDVNGHEPVTTDAKNLAWGVYATEAGARAAYTRLKSP